MKDMKEFIARLPKAELHLHIEGTLEPELLFALAKKNHIKLPYKSLHEVKNAYRFTNLQSFLDLYYQASQVLIDEEDFYQLTWNYFKKVSPQNVQHVELFFDPQTHLSRQIPFETVLNGIYRGCLRAQQELNISTHIIACFLRDQTEQQALKVFDIVSQHQDKIIGIGLDSAEIGHPPSKFKKLYSLAKSAGFRRVAHAGEEGPPEYIWQAIDILDAERIDHGIRCIEDANLIDYLAATKLPLTVCPLSNVRLKVVKSLKRHPLKQLLDYNLCITINSDDPAYFDGYIDQNFLSATEALNLTKEQLVTVAKNSFLASFLTHSERKPFLAQFRDIYY